MEFLKKNVFKILVAFCIVFVFAVFNAQGQIISDDLIFLKAQVGSDANKDIASYKLDKYDVLKELGFSQEKKAPHKSYMYFY